MWLYLRQELALHRLTFTEQQNISAVEYILNIYAVYVHYKWFINSCSFGFLDKSDENVYLSSLKFNLSLILII